MASSSRNRRRPTVTTEPSPSGRNRIVNSNAEPRMICQVPGMRSTAIERTSSNTKRADECGRDRARAGQDRDEDEAAGRRPIGHVRDQHARRQARRARRRCRPDVPAMTSLRWMSRLTEMPRNSSGSRCHAPAPPASPRPSGNRARPAARRAHPRPSTSQNSASSSARPCGMVAEERPGFHVKAVGRAERLGLHQYAVEDHRHGEAEHGEEDVAIAREQKPDQKGDDPRYQRRRDHE